MASQTLNPAQAIGVAARLQPEQLAAVEGAPPLAAVWAHEAIATRVSGLPMHAIALHLSGCTLVEKWRDASLVGHHSSVGSVTLIPAWEPSSWCLGGASRVAHLYIDPVRLDQARESTGAPWADVRLRDFFAEHDLTLAALIHGVLAESARCGADGLDPLYQDHVETLAVRHLLQRYAEGDAKGTAPPLTLTAATLRRLFAYMDARLDATLRLAELAAVARLSPDHFVRAFRKSVGQTPHQYLLSRRIDRARQLLARTRRPVADIARETGFRGPSHFAASFRQRAGVSPSAWRASRKGS